MGRRGPVCPFVPTSLKKNTIYMSVIRAGDGGVTTKEGMSELVRSFAPIFDELKPTKGRLVKHKAIILIFPDVEVADAPELIDQVQLECKPDFVSRGLMLGEFHMANNAPGLRNPDFFPLRTPFPSLAIRHMVPTDLVFLQLDGYVHV